MIGVATFAISGALAAKARRYDLLGVIIIAVVTALGGGTLRDVLLGRLPVFWMLDTRFLIIAICAAVIAFFVPLPLQRPRYLVLTLDALGLGVFAVLGAEIGIRVGVPALSAIIVGMMTASFGGLVRDVLFTETPSILHIEELYATAALLGAAVYVLLPFVLPDLATTTRQWLGITITFCTRIASLYFKWSLPRAGNTIQPLPSTPPSDK